MQSITVLKLEKRLDDCLRYLRDAAPEHSTVPFDITPEVRSPDAPVPINPIKVCSLEIIVCLVLTSIKVKGKCIGIQKFNDMHLIGKAEK